MSMMSLYILIAAGLNWGCVAFYGKDILEMYDVGDKEFYGKRVDIIVYLVFAMAALYMVYEMMTHSKEA